RGPALAAARIGRRSHRHGPARCRRRHGVAPPAGARDPPARSLRHDRADPPLIETDLADTRRPRSGLRGLPRLVAGLPSPLLPGLRPRPLAAAPPAKYLLLENKSSGPPGEDQAEKRSLPHCLRRRPVSRRIS